MKSRQCLSVKLQTVFIDRSRENGVRWSGGGGDGGGRGVSYLVSTGRRKS